MYEPEYSSKREPTNIYVLALRVVIMLVTLGVALTAIYRLKTNGLSPSLLRAVGIDVHSNAPNSAEK